MSASDRAERPITLLIASVGGTPDPIVASLKNWQPARVLFVPSEETRNEIESRVLPLAASEGLQLSPGCYDFCVLPDGQDLSACIRKLRDLNAEVARWLDRGSDYRIVVDFTGGTKCMSAALAIHSHRWQCLFSYIGGSQRTKGGVGVVVSGAEKVVFAENPWDALGYQAVEEALTLFNEGAYASSRRLLDQVMLNIGDAARRRQVNALKLLADAYDAWDRFDHKAARNNLAKLAGAANDLQAQLNVPSTEQLLTVVSRHMELLATLDASRGPSLSIVLDLLANAQRRGREGRYDDAVARLYRAIEAFAQHQLREPHGIGDTGNVPLERIPEPLRSEWAPYARDGLLKLALQDSYALLRQLHDCAGAAFHELGLDDREKSPLFHRNLSILAHGFQPVGEKAFQQLWSAALSLTSLTSEEIPEFPRLPTSF
jgi:CRISPR-associated protein (TIGR02710 family)